MILGTVVAISRGSGGYVIEQPHSDKGKGGSNLMAPPAGNVKTRRAISFPLGPLVVSFNPCHCDSFNQLTFHKYKA